MVKLAGHERRQHTRPGARVRGRGARRWRRSPTARIERGRRRRHPQRGPGRRPRHARDARRHGRDQRRRASARRSALHHRRALLRRDARLHGRPRRARGRAGRPDRAVQDGDTDHHRRRRAAASTSTSPTTEIAARVAAYDAPVNRRQHRRAGQVRQARVDRVAGRGHRPSGAVATASRSGPAARSRGVEAASTSVPGSSVQEVREQAVEARPGSSSIGTWPVSVEDDDARVGDQAARTRRLAAGRAGRRRPTRSASGRRSPAAGRGCGSGRAPPQRATNPGLPAPREHARRRAAPSIRSGWRSTRSAAPRCAAAAAARSPRPARRQPAAASRRSTLLASSESSTARALARSDSPAARTRAQALHALGEADRQLGADEAAHRVADDGERRSRRARPAARRRSGA